MSAKPELPEDITAEAAVLGSVLIDPEALWQIRGDLQTADFSDARHGAIYAAMLALADAGQPLDYLTITGELRDAGKFGKDGVSLYVSGLIEAVPSSINVLGYAERVVDAAQRRRLLALASEIAKRAHNRQDEVDATQTWLVSAAQTGGRGGDLHAVRDLSVIIYDELEYNITHPLHPGQVRALDTGWRDINAKLGGWRPGLYLVLGEPHVGKSWFVLQAAAQVAATGKRVLMFSLEMTAKQLGTRLCLSAAQITQSEYDLGRIPDAKLPAFSKRVGELEEWDLDIVDDIETASAIFATIHRECRGDNPPALVVIDYLGLIVTEYRSETVNYELGALLRAMKRLADQCQVPLLVPHQISDKATDNRQDKRPRKSDAYGTGGASQHADVILGLYRDDLHNEESPNKNIMEVINLKDRLSGTADPYSSIPLYFEPTGRLADSRNYGGE